MIPVEVESWKISRLAEGGSNPVEVRMSRVEVKLGSQIAWEKRVVFP